MRTFKNLEEIYKPRKKNWITEWQPCILAYILKAYTMYPHIPGSLVKKILKNMRHKIEGKITEKAIFYSAVSWCYLYLTSKTIQALVNIQNKN